MENSLLETLTQTVQQSPSPVFMCDQALNIVAYSLSFRKSLAYFDDDIHTLFDSNTLQRIKRSGKTGKPIRCKSKNIPFQLQVSINWIKNGSDTLMLGIVEKNFIHPAIDSIFLAYSCMEQLGLTQKILVNQLRTLDSASNDMTNILAQADALNHYYSDMQNCMNILTDRMFLNKIDTDLNRILRRTLARIQQTAQDRNIRIIFNTPKTMLMIPCDLKHMIRAIGDCLYNILYFSHEGHYIQLNVTEQDNAYMIEMINPLFKIPEEYTGHLFTRYAITSLGNDHAGLYFANTIIQKHGGTLTFDNSATYGYKLILTLPKSSTHILQFNDIDDSDLCRQIDEYLEQSFFDL